MYGELGRKQIKATRSAVKNFYNWKSNENIPESWAKNLASDMQSLHQNCNFSINLNSIQFNFIKSFL